MSDVRQQVIAEAITWLCTPYHHEASVKGGGVDCAQFLIEVYAAVGLITRPDVGHYSHDWMMHRSEEMYMGWVEQYCIEVDAPGMGDIVLFKFGRCFSHSAIVIDYPRIIHAQREDGCCFADANQGALAGREARFYRVIGVAV
jgi:cell wall-associated NlpC family hydrolase